jgi:hypothetical protein
MIPVPNRVRKSRPRRAGRVLAAAALAACSLPACFADEASGANADLIREVEQGRRPLARAEWWGFNAEDATDALQRAVDSKARTVVIGYRGAPWVLRPIRLRSNLELILEPGVELLAKAGEFRRNNECLLKASDATDVTIRGYGALLRMRKNDYRRPPYEKGEWRMGVSLVGCLRVRVEGLRIESSGGDGIYVGSSAKHRWCQDVVIRDCVCHDNYRQGISVISAHRLLVENCTLSGTEGTAPESGIDFEPDVPDERLSECVVRNCRFEDNAGHAILVYLSPLTSQSRPVSILFENCLCRMSRFAALPAAGGPAAPAASATLPKLEPFGGAGMAVGTVRDDGPSGTVEFRRCVAESTGRQGARIYDKAAGAEKLRFVECSWKSPWRSQSPQAGPASPLTISLRDAERTTRPGGVEFVDCHVYLDAAVPVLVFHDETGKHPLHDVSGTLTVHAPKDAKVDAELGSHPIHTNLRLQRADRTPQASEK